MVVNRSRPINHQVAQKSNISVLNVPVLTTPASVNDGSTTLPSRPINNQVAQKSNTVDLPAPVNNRSATLPSQQNRTQRTECALGSSAVNTHFFDGKLPSFAASLSDVSIAQEIENDISRAALISNGSKTECFHQLDEKVKNYALMKNGSIPTNAVKYLRLIISTHERFGRIASPSNGNYDPANKLHACDLLYLLYEKIMSEEEPEYMRLMLEQLDEMSTGDCPVGRTTRLFQALVMLRDDLTPTSKPID